MMMFFLLVLFCGAVWAHPSQDQGKEKCGGITVAESSKRFFESRLTALTPHFVHMMLRINKTYESTPEVFQPLHWVWTYSTPSTTYPYLSWNIDHGLLSFGLLDVKTINITFILIDVPNQFNITFGEDNTTENIACALTTMLDNISKNGYQEYEYSYFCYYSLNPELKNTAEYAAAVYLSYPILYLNYRCCREYYDYMRVNYTQTCFQNDNTKWIQCTLGPYILSLVFFIYFPIFFLQMLAWISKDEVLGEGEQQREMSADYERLESNEIKWTYLDGTPPITFLMVLNIPSLICNGRYLHIVSRLRRTLVAFLFPSLIFVEVGMYSNGIGKPSIAIKDLVKSGVPVGFLNLLADKEDTKTFATIFGGPLCILFLYYVLSIVFIVLPSSTKRIVDRGIPQGCGVSPLCLGKDDIINLSMYLVNPEPGYETAYVICKGGLFMLFSKLFWKRVFEIQRYRFNWRFFDYFVYNVILIILIIPFYLILCCLEIILCVILYGMPAIGLVTIAIRGAVKSLYQNMNSSSRACIFRNPLTMFLIIIIGVCMFLFYIYITCLISIQGFYFLSQIIIFCFVAVVIYPSYSFGYLFFAVVLIYYVVHLMKNFGHDYLELLSLAVEKSYELENYVNNTTVFKGQLTVSNVQTRHLKSIHINDVRLEVPQNVLQTICSRRNTQRLSEIDNVYGVPTRLFEYLVRKHRPVHIQTLKVLFHLAIVIGLILLAISITSQVTTGATSEVSDVMHVIFIITVGALPHVIEVGLMNSSETVKREIEMRKIEHSIKEFWMLETEDSLLIN